MGSDELCDARLLLSVLHSAQQLQSSAHFVLDSVQPEIGARSQYISNMQFAQDIRLTSSLADLFSDRLGIVFKKGLADSPVRLSLDVSASWTVAVRVGHSPPC
jgi:hypothetical protein